MNPILATPLAVALLASPHAARARLLPQAASRL